MSQQNPQNPYPYGQSDPHSPYGQQGGYPGAQPGWGQQGGYPQSGYGQPGYGTPQQAYAAGQPGAPYGQPAPARSPLVGMIGLGVVVICGIVFCWMMWRMGALMVPILATTGTVDQQEATELLMQQLGANGMLMLNVSVYGGIGGWVTGIVAAASKRGRAYGVWAIILGVLAPIIGVVMMVAALMPYIG